MLPRKTPMRSRTGFTGPRKALRKIGRQGRENAKANKEGDAEIAKLGIEWCEIRISPNCTGRHALTRAHRRKRRDCSAAELRVFAYACTTCHDVIEAKPHAVMFQIVNDAIEARSK